MWIVRKSGEIYTCKWIYSWTQVCWVSTTVRLSSTNECDTKTMNTTTGHMTRNEWYRISCQSIHPPPEQGARVGLFIERVQRSYYNTLNASNHLPLQSSTGGNLDYYIRAPPLTGQSRAATCRAGPRISD
jgi:hypothetical protein